jgi:hypothetical protein
LFSIRLFVIIGRFSIGFSTRGVSIGVSGVTLGVKLELTFEFDNLLNPDLLDSEGAGSILRKYSNCCKVALKVAFVYT